MTRSRASAKAAGSGHERSQADYFVEHVSEFIDRRVKTGANDKGDLVNLRTVAGARVVAELKNCAPPVPVKGQQKLSLGPWLNEASVERINDGADVGLVIFKRHGVGDPGRQVVAMEVDDLIALLTGKRPSGKGSVPGDAVEALPAAPGVSTGIVSETINLETHSVVFDIEKGTYRAEPRSNYPAGHPRGPIEPLFSPGASTGIVGHSE